MPSPKKIKRKQSLKFSKPFKKLSIPKSHTRFPSKSDLSFEKLEIKKTPRKAFNLILNTRRILPILYKQPKRNLSVDNNFKFFTDNQDLSTQWGETYIRRKSHYEIIQKDSISLSQSRFTTQHRLNKFFKSQITIIKTKIKLLGMYKSGQNRTYIELDDSDTMEPQDMNKVSYVSPEPKQYVPPAELKKTNLRKNMNALHINTNLMENFMEKITKRNNYIQNLCFKRPQIQQQAKISKRLPSLILTTLKVSDFSKFYDNFSQLSSTKNKLDFKDQSILDLPLSSQRYFSKKRVIDTYVSDKHLKSKRLI